MTDSTTMAAICKRESQPGLHLSSVPVPKVGAHEVLIRIRKTAICGTDLHIYHWDSWAKQHIHPPLVVGHEFVGEIVEVGEAVYGFSVGERVSGEGHLTCGVCLHCRAGQRHFCNDPMCVGVDVAGAFATYLVLPAANVCKVPEFISDEVACLLDPLGNAIHAAMVRDLTGADVLITGAGPIGLMAAKIAQFSGARQVVLTDVQAYRLKLATQLGCLALPSDSECLQAFKRAQQRVNGFSHGLEMSGHPDSLQLLISEASHGAIIALLGFLPQQTTIDWSAVVFKGLTLKGIYGRKLFATWQKAFALLEAGLAIEGVITHCMPYTDFEQAFDLLDQGLAGKIILDWDS